MELHSYQKEGIEFIAKKQKCALWFGMGMGKTILTLTSIQQLRDQFLIDKVLIIAPLKVAKKVWSSEIENCPHLKHLTYSIVVGTPAQKTRALNVDCNIYITNKESLGWLYKAKSFKFDMIVIDESSCFKNGRTQLFKVMKKFKYNYMVQLTGTPTPNGLLELWSQIYLLDGGDRLGKSFLAYRTKYFYSDYSGFKFYPKNSEVIYNAISDIVLAMKVEDYLTMPDITYSNNIVDIDCYKSYEELKKEFIVHVDGYKVKAVNAAVLAGKLLQFANGSIYTNDKDVVELHSAKLDGLAELVEKYDENVLVAYHFKSDLVRLQNRFKHAVVLTDDPLIENSWNKGEIKMLLCQPSSCGKGLNLQKGGRIVIWFGLTWSAENYKQFNSRVYRQGQSKPVIIDHIISRNTIDEKVLQVLEDKGVTQDDLFKYVMSFMSKLSK